MSSTFVHESRHIPLFVVCSFTLQMSCQCPKDVDITAETISGSVRLCSHFSDSVRDEKDSGVPSK